MAARMILLTGERGVGKSTVCRKTIALVQARRYTCGGLLTLHRSNGALDVLDVRSGYVRRLTLQLDESPAVIQGRFRFDPEALVWGNNTLTRATPCHLLVVDELGPLELEREQGWLQAFDVLHESDFTLALVVVRPELVVRAQLNLPASATTVLSVTSDNRDGLPAVLLEMLERELTSTP
ncbi:MAG: nucleoside-triphosphatase [Anaerolineae bacterium]